MKRYDDYEKYVAIEEAYEALAKQPRVSIKVAIDDTNVYFSAYSGRARYGMAYDRDSVHIEDASAIASTVLAAFVGAGLRTDHGQIEQEIRRVLSAKQ